MQVFQVMVTTFPLVGIVVDVVDCVTEDLAAFRVPVPRLHSGGRCLENGGGKYAVDKSIALYRFRAGIV